MMKACIYLLTLFTTVNAGAAPHVSVGISSTDGLEPILKWTTSGAAGDFDYDAGVDVIVEGTKDLPYRAWAKLKRRFGDYNVMAMGSVKSKNLESVDLEINADGPLGAVQVMGTAGQKSAVDRFQIRRAFPLFGGTVSVNPRYSVADKSFDASVGYGAKGTFVGINTSDEKLTVSQRVGEKNAITPSITKSGDVAIAYTRDIETGRLTTTYAPNKSAKVEWKDGPWMAILEAPVDGLTNFGKVDVSFRRRVDFN